MKNLVSAIIIILCVFSVNAQESKIIGNWQLTQVEVGGKTETGLRAVFVFADNGVLKAARNSESKTVDVGTWKYNKKKKLIVMTSTLDKDFNGEASAVEVNEKELVYKKDGAILSFIKLANMHSSIKIEMEKPTLSFEMDDLYDDEDGFDEEAEAEKLPWKIVDVVNYLKEKNEIVFTVTGFPDSEEADTRIESIKFKYDNEAQTLDARWYSYFGKDYIDVMENSISVEDFQENSDEFRFYPSDNLDYYKVISTNKIIKTTLGNFECTVVEGFGSFNKKVQYWMINNQPGVFAKIIEVADQEPPFGNTNVYSIKEIK